MDDTLAIAVRRAAGAALRALKRKGASPHRLAHASREEPLRPAAAIEALIAAMRSRFALPEKEADELLRPALADWRDAVGCADPLLVADNAQRSGGDAHLLPLPMPSWCAALVDAGIVVLDGAPALEGPRVVQRAWLAVVREAELTAVECFPIVFAGRYGSGAASLQLHVALSPPYLDDGWRGTVCLRAGAQRLDKARPAPRFWLGAPAAPRAVAAGVAGESAVTWVMARSGESSSPGWPRGWPRWAVIRLLEGREPQALWHLPALWRARMGDSPEAGLVDELSAAPGTLRIAADVGSTSTLVVEEDSAAAGSVGRKLLSTAGRAPALSGFRRLAGDPHTAHRVGCSEQLLAPGGQLPTALASADANAIAALLGGATEAVEQLWLPQGPSAEENGLPLIVDRFKSPELLLLSDWLARVAPEHDRADASRRLLDAYAYQLGRTLAAAHAAPLVTPEGGRWTLRAPRLASIDAVLAYPECGFDAEARHPFRELFQEAAGELCRGLLAAWPQASHRLVADPTAARAGRGRAADARHPIDAFVDFGGLTLQVTVELPHAVQRPAPLIAGSSMSYLLGGERLIDASAFARAAREAPADLRDAYRAAARRWRTLISTGGALRDADAARHPRVGEVLLELVLALVRRQLEGTLRRAAPDLSTLRGAGVRLVLLGEGWKLAALDVEDEVREAEALRRIDRSLVRHPLLDAPLHVERMTKRRVCEGALRLRAAETRLAAATELQGVDVGSAEGVRQRWFGVAGSALDSDPDLRPHADDPWWREFSSGSDSLLRVEQWFSAPPGISPFDTGLAGGNIAFDARRSLLKQWLDVSGPSLAALRIHQALAPG